MGADININYIHGIPYIKAQNLVVPKGFGDAYCVVVKYKNLSDKLNELDNKMKIKNQKLRNGKLNIMNV